MPWFEQWPDLAAWELDRFERRGFPATLDEAERRAGRFVVRTRTTFRKSEIEIVVRYPAEYPELPPLVYGPPGLLERHQQPFGGNFCLLESPFDDWPSGEWGAADLLAERLQALLRDSEAGPEAVRAAEAPVPEPYTAHYRYPLGPVVLMPGDLTPTSGSRGALRLRAFHPEGFRFLVEPWTGARAEGLHNVLPDGPVFVAQWLRQAAPPPGPDGAALASWLRRHHADLLPPTVPPKLRKSRHLKTPALTIVGLVFPEEGNEVGSERDGWLFVAIPAEREPFLIHHQALSLAERQRRAPELRGLANQSAVVVGLGTIGGDVALELAKAGLGRLELVDHDRYEVNNALRHVLGAEWSGISKSQAMAATCRRINPFCLAEPHELLIGVPEWNGKSSLDELEALIEGADVVVEATGTNQILALLGRLSDAYDVPLVSCSMTNGYLGAEVVRIRPGRTSCFLCYARSARDGELPAPEAGDEPDVATQGCSHPTTTGSGFDASEAAAVAARLTVQTLLDGDGYPDAAWDRAVMNFRRPPDDAEFPRFSSASLPRREGCPRCARLVGSHAPL